MTAFQAQVQPTSWLFTRGEASVRMAVDDQSPGAVLIVRGPGTAMATYDFPDLQALMDFAELEEQKLQQAGFQLQAIAERRSGDRASEGRAVPDRRRR